VSADRGAGMAASETHINQAGDTYDVRCSCGWEALDVETLETAGHLLALHRGDEHFDE
jgi:hypothetical protein